MNDTREPYERLDGPPGQGPSLLGRILGAAIGLLLLAGALVFSVFLFAALAIVGAALWGFLWWKTRALRRHMRTQMEQMQEQARQRGAAPESDAPGAVIEGEFVREEESVDPQQRTRSTGR